MNNFMIIGDSYSTYQGCIPEGYAVYYSPNGMSAEQPASKMAKEDTWWMRFIAKTGWNLVQNNSWSGSTIGYTSYEGRDVSMSASYIYRYRQLLRQDYFRKNNIDTLFVFGGTNDSWCEAPLGEVKYDGFTEKELYNVLPAICYLMKTMSEDLAGIRVIFLLNCGLKAQIGACMKEAGARYGIDVVELKGIEKLGGHPNARGMEQICEQVIASL